MVLYNFKTVQVVPSAKDFIDIVLSKTQRKTPTVVHRHYLISRIRKFYMRKVKFTAQTYRDKLNQILTDFPLLDEIHPFYADLINVLYDRDHFKLALGQLNTARSLIDHLGQDYLRLLKYGDSLYRCKQLKRAALGRMCTILKKQAANLAYLEQVRQHLARLPSIDPTARTIIICGYPNVGKSSFMNKVTRANVDVQPYAFTTKALYVGHTDYRYLRWQVIDTPGILDHPLEDRNTIEMQSITALAHLKAAILYIVDASETCGFSLKQQIDLFNSIKPLFSNKPLIVAVNKTDVMTLSDLKGESKELMDKLAAQENLTIMPMSTLTEEGVSQVKEFVCDRLLEQRVEQKLNSSKLDNSIQRLLHVAQPVPRDRKLRPPFIPTSVFEKRVAKASPMEDEDTNKQTTEKPEATFDTYNLNDPIPEELDDFDPTVFGPDHRVDYMLKDDEWKFDTVPEILNGKNIADFIDPEILEKLDELEREEEEQQAIFERQLQEEAAEYEPLNPDEQAKFQMIQDKMTLARHEHVARTKIMRATPRPNLKRSRSVDDFEKHFAELGIDPSKAVEKLRSRSRGRSHSRPAKKQRTSSQSVDAVRSATKSPAPGEGYKDLKQKIQVTTTAHKDQNRKNKRNPKKGEADRTILNLKPKHLFAGKRGIGKNQRR